MFWNRRLLWRASWRWSMVTSWESFEAENFEDTKGVIRNYKLKKEKRTNYYLENTTRKTKDFSLTCQFFLFIFYKRWQLIFFFSDLNLCCFSVWLGARVAQWVRSLDLTAHTSLSPIRRGFAPSFVNYKKGCTRLAAASDKVYQLLAHGRWFSRVVRLLPPLKLVAMI